MITLIGRKEEIKTLEDRNSRQQAQFIAVYGRRRVGKTFLIQNFFRDRAQYIMEVVGEHKASKNTQLSNFRLSLERTFGPVHQISSWKEAFQALAGSLSRIASSSPQPVLIFLDEFPWMDTHKSGLVESLGYIWETEMKRFPFLRLVICGSAASWMIRHIINDKGSLHNRVTEILQIEPFRLSEVEQYFLARDIHLNRSEVLYLYLLLGGIPYYLDYIRRGESPVQAISRMCFGKGPLVGERNRLFRALFTNHETHDNIIEALAKNRGGLTRSELLSVTKINSGGNFNKSTKELIESGFVAPIKAWSGKKKERKFRLFDPFLLFYYNCATIIQYDVLDAQLSHEEWYNFRKSQSHASQLGYAFENCCLYHLAKIRKSLGLNHIGIRASTWRKIGVKENTGGQVDLLFDRDDGRITLCEMKHYPNGFVIDKKYADWISKRTEIFKKDTRTKKNADNVLICSHGASNNTHLRRVFSQVITADDLF